MAKCIKARAIIIFKYHSYRGMLKMFTLVGVRGNSEPAILLSVHYQIQVTKTMKISQCVECASFVPQMNDFSFTMLQGRRLASHITVFSRFG